MSTKPVVLGGGHAPIGWSVGFLRAPFADVRHATLQWWWRLRRKLSETTLSSAFPDAFLALAPLQTPPTREFLVRTAGDTWTANLVNNHLGGDSASWCGHLSDVLGCEAVQATHIPIGHYPYPTTSLRLTSPGAPGPLHVLRVVDARIEDDGRWRFATTGEIQFFEEQHRYTRRRIRDRFDRDMLVRYLAALGIHVDDPHFWIDGVLLQNVVTFESRTSTLEATRREYGLDTPSPRST